MLIINKRNYSLYRNLLYLKADFLVHPWVPNGNWNKALLVNCQQSRTTRVLIISIVKEKDRQIDTSAEIKVRVQTNNGFRKINDDKNRYVGSQVRKTVVHPLLHLQSL